VAVVTNPSEDERGVILMHGTNLNGDPIWCYLNISIEGLRAMKIASDNGSDFKPSHFGDVLASGLGTPTREMQMEMARKYNLAPFPLLPSEPQARRMPELLLPPEVEEHPLDLVPDHTLPPPFSDFSILPSEEP
jgi:hypothetical protein